MNSNEYKINDSDVSIDDIIKAIKGMKPGKAAEYDGVSVEMLQAGHDFEADQLYSLFNVCWEKIQVSKDWSKAVIVPQYKGEGSQ